MSGCDPFEIAIEMRLHGALDAPAAADLDRHLASCEACRRFEALARTSEGTMQGTAAAVASSMDWERVRAAVREHEYRDRLKRFIIATPLLVPAIGWAFGRDAMIGACFTGVAATALVAVLRAFERRGEPRGDEAEAKTPVIDFARSVADERIRANRNDAVLALGAGFVVLAVAAALELLWHAPGRLAVFVGAIGVALFAAAAYRRFVAGRRLERERAELE